MDYPKVLVYPSPRRELSNLKVFSHLAPILAYRQGRGSFSIQQSDMSQKIFIGKKIDLCFINRADPLLLKKISETAFLLYGRHRSFEEFKSYAFKRFEDYKPYFRIEERFVRRYIKELSLAHR